MTFWKGQNSGDPKNTSGWWGLGGMTRGSTEDSEGSEDTLCVMTVVETCHATFVQSHRMHNARSEL